MSASDEKARRANGGLNFEAFSETNISTVPRTIEPARQRYLARRVQALGGRALFELFAELSAGAPLAGRLSVCAAFDPAILAALSARRSRQLRD
jgi:hypothetical protein